MKRIKEVRLQHFKAFQNEQVFDFKGKNILVYGNNGAGKSSLFWALYTFLQSSIKEDDESVTKYFDHFVESNTATHQTLKNMYAEEDDAPFIEVVIQEDDGNTQAYKIDASSPPTRPENNGNDTSIQELNLASDFINYKLLHNFYSATHKNEINLWSVFERDIFPFLTEGTKSWLTIIKDETLDVPRTAADAVVSGIARDSYVIQLITLAIIVVD